MSSVKTLDEIRIDADILIIGIDNLCQNEDKLEAIVHLEESIKYLKDGIKRCQAVDGCATPPVEGERSSEDDANNSVVDTKKIKPPDTPSLSLLSYSHDSNRSVQSNPIVGEVTVKTINCPYCNFSSLSVHSLRAHMSRHTSQIKCELCDAYFARACNLKRHLRGTLHKQRLRGMKRALESENNSDTSSQASSAGSQVDPECEISGIKRLKRASVIVPLPRSISSSASDKQPEAEVNDGFPSSNTNLHQMSSLNVTSNSKKMKTSMNFEPRVDLCRLSKTLSKESMENLLNNNSDKANIPDTDGVLFSEPSTSAPHPFTCDICFKSYSRKEYLTQHMVEHTDKYKCDNCLQTFSNMRRLRNHKKRPENCARLLSIRDKALQKHTKLSSDRMGVEDASNNIPPDSPQEGELVIDVKGEAEVEEPSLICQKCGALVSSVEEMKNHLSQFHDVQMYDGCLTTAPIKSDQDQDYNQDLQEVDVFHCEICDKLFSSKQSLRNHQVSHTDRFRCGSCNFGFSSKKFLELHTGNPDNCDRLRKKRMRPSDDDHLHVDASSFVMAVINDINE